MNKTDTYDDPNVKELAERFGEEPGNPLPADKQMFVEGLKELRDKFLAADEAVDKLETQLKEAKKEKGELAGRLLTQFDVLEMQNMKGADKTIYKARTLSVSVLKEHRQAIIEECKSIGLEDVVTVLTGSIKAYVRECIGDEHNLEKIPKGLEPLLSVYSDVELRIKKN